MQRREYFQWAHRYLRGQRTIRTVEVKCHDIDTSLLEGVLSRGDRRIAPVIELAWRRGARLDSWREHLDAARWWQALADCQVNAQQVIHEPYAMTDKLPWDHLNVKYGRTFLEKEQIRSVAQLAAMAESP
jgi:hypothetical protein